MKFLVDTCILVDHLQGQAAATRFLEAQRGAAISLVTWMEVMAGAESADEAEALRALLAGFELLAVDAQVAEEAVVLRRERRLKLPDAVILATARVHDLEFATRNTRDFKPSERGVVVPYKLG